MEEVEPVQAIQMNNYQSDSYRKDFSWLHFDDEPRVQETQRVKDQYTQFGAMPSFLIKKFFFKIFKDKIRLL